MKLYFIWVKKTIISRWIIFLVCIYYFSFEFDVILIKLNASEIFQKNILADAILCKFFLSKFVKDDLFSNGPPSYDDIIFSYDYFMGLYLSKMIDHNMYFVHSTKPPT